MKFTAYLAALLHTQRIARAAVVLMLLAGITQSTWSELQNLSAALPSLLLFPDRSAQARLALGPDLYDALAVANAVLPPRASLLLVTAGSDPRHEEYVAFHRALYELAPRPVWWTNPAAPDASWESRWWVQSALTPDALTTLALDKGAAFILFDRVQVPDGLGPSVDLTGSARLVSLRAEPPGSRAGDSTPELDPPPQWLALLVGLGVVYALGHALLASAARLGSTLGRIERMAIAWQLGAGAVTILMLWLNALGLSLQAQTRSITLLALAAVLAVESPHLRRVELRNLRNYRLPSLSVLCVAAYSAYGRKRLSFAQFGLAVLVVIQIAYVALLAIGRPLLVWDSWVNWAMKARIIFLEQSITPDVFAGASRTVTHLDYPLFLPLLEAWLFAWAGTTDDRLAGVSALLFFVSLLAVCYGVSRHSQASRMWAVLTVLLVATLTPLSGLGVAVLADLPLAALAATMAAFVVRWLESRARGDLLIAALAAGLLPWTKREGIVLLLVLCLVLILARRAERPAFLASGALVLAGLALSGPWWAFIALHGIPAPDFVPVTLPTLLANIGRVPSIARLVMPDLLSGNWNFVWPLAALVAVPALRTARRTTALRLVTALLYLALLSAAYIFSAYVPYQQHVASSIDRLIAHVGVWPTLWLAAQALDSTSASFHHGDSA